MGGQARWSEKIVICLQNPPNGMIPISAQLLNVQFSEFFEHLPDRYLRFSF